MLLKSGAGPNIATDDGQTPVHVAARHGNLTTVDLLLADGGDPINKSNVRQSTNLARWHTNLIKSTAPALISYQHFNFNF